MAKAKEIWKVYENAKKDGAPSDKLRQFLLDGVKAVPMAPVLHLGLVELSSTKEASILHASTAIKLVKKLTADAPSESRARRLAYALLRLSAQLKKRKLFDLAERSCVVALALAEPFRKSRQEAAVTLVFDCRMALASVLRKRGQIDDAAKEFDAAADLIGLVKEGGTEEQRDVSYTEKRKERQKERKKERKKGKQHYANEPTNQRKLKTTQARTLLGLCVQGIDGRPRRGSSHRPPRLAL